MDRYNAPKKILNELIFEKNRHSFIFLFLLKTCQIFLKVETDLLTVITGRLTGLTDQSTDGY
jgi:hypothetical protein